MGTDFYVMDKTKSFNFRICTHVDEKSGQRFFSIREVYYKKDTPVGYSEGDNPFNSIESVESIPWLLKAMDGCTKKPILNLDNFPSEWIKEEPDINE